MYIYNSVHQSELLDLSREFAKFWVKDTFPCVFGSKTKAGGICFANKKERVYRRFCCGNRNLRLRRLGEATVREHIEGKYAYYTMDYRRGFFVLDIDAHRGESDDDQWKAVAKILEVFPHAVVCKSTNGFNLYQYVRHPSIVIEEGRWRHTRHTRRTASLRDLFHGPHLADTKRHLRNVKQVPAGDKVPCLEGELQALFRREGIICPIEIKGTPSSLSSNYSECLFGKLGKLPLGITPELLDRFRHHKANHAITHDDLDKLIDRLAAQRRSFEAARSISVSEAARSTSIVLPVSEIVRGERPVGARLLNRDTVLGVPCALARARLLTQHWLRAHQRRHNTTDIATAEELVRWVEDNGYYTGDLDNPSRYKRFADTLAYTLATFDSKKARESRPLNTKTSRFVEDLARRLAGREMPVIRWDTDYLTWWPDSIKKIVRPYEAFVRKLLILFDNFVGTNPDGSLPTKWFKACWDSFMPAVSWNEDYFRAVRDYLAKLGYVSIDRFYCHNQETGRGRAMKWVKGVNWQMSVDDLRDCFVAGDNGKKETDVTPVFVEGRERGYNVCPIPVPFFSRIVHFKRFTSMFRSARPPPHSRGEVKNEHFSQIDREGTH